MLSVLPCNEPIGDLRAETINPKQRRFRRLLLLFARERVCWSCILSLSGARPPLAEHSTVNNLLQNAMSSTTLLHIVLSLFCADMSGWRVTLENFNLKTCFAKRPHETFFSSLPE